MASRSLKRLPALPADVDVVSAAGVTVDVNGVGIGVVVDIPPDEDGRFDLGLFSLSGFHNYIQSTFFILLPICDY